MPHPLQTARPSDPFLRFRLDEETVGEFAIVGDHVAYSRPGRNAGETWVSALGDDAERIVALARDLVMRVKADGIHVHDSVFDSLPDDLLPRESGHWSMWILPPGALARPEPVDLPDPACDVVELHGSDPRIDQLLRQSDSAYVFSADPSVGRWLGIEAGDRLVCVGARQSTLEGTPHLVSICTDREFRGQGLATALTHALCRGAIEHGNGEVYLEMYAGNGAAATVYSRLGFVEVGRYRSGFLPRA